MRKYLEEPREERLPIWAQDALIQARRERDDAQLALIALRNQIPQTRVWHGDYDNPIYVPTDYGHTNVHFDMGNAGLNTYDDIQVHFDVNRKELEIIGGRQLCIAPTVSNLFKVGFIDE